MGQKGRSSSGSSTSAGTAVFGTSVGCGQMPRREHSMKSERAVRRMSSLVTSMASSMPFQALWADRRQWIMSWSRAGKSIGGWPLVLCGVDVGMASEEASGGASLGGGEFAGFGVAAASFPLGSMSQLLRLPSLFTLVIVNTSAAGSRSRRGPTLSR